MTDIGTGSYTIIAQTSAEMMGVPLDKVPKRSLQIAEWCHYLKYYALYAIRKAAKWNVLSRKKLPSIAEFIIHVKLAIGVGVLSGKK